MQNLEPCGERLVRNDVTSYHGWVKRCFLIFAIIWILFGLYYAATGTDEITKDTRHWATMGYTEPSDRLKPQLPVVTVGTEIRRYRLVTYNPPKHLYVTIKDLEANVTYESLYVSKHCNNHTLNKIGDDYNIQITHKQQGENKWIVFNNLYDVFCGN